MYSKKLVVLTGKVGKMKFRLNNLLVYFIFFALKSTHLHGKSNNKYVNSQIISEKNRCVNKKKYFLYYKGLIYKKSPAHFSMQAGEY